MGRTRAELAQAIYDAYVRGDRAVVEAMLDDDFAFYSPADVGIGRAAYFERCWPNAERLVAFQMVRAVEHGDEVIVTYEAVRTDGTRFRNTEVLTFAEARLRRAEVYFGWEITRNC